MKIRIALFTFLIISMPLANAQVLEKYMMANPQQISEMTDTLPFVCPWSEGTWLNADYYDAPRSFKTKLSIIHFASFDHIGSRQSIIALTKLQIAYPTLNIVLVHIPAFNYPSTDLEVAHEMGILRSPLPIFAQADRVFAKCNNVEKAPLTLFLLPGGKILERFEGILELHHLEAAYRRLLPSYESLIALNKEPFYPRAALNRVKRPILREPFGLAANSEEGFLFVSDRGGNRIIAVTPSGDMVYNIGNGRAGFADGEMRTAEFDNPTGLAYDSKNNVLYVADSRNHRIRKVDLAQKTVSTLLGDGMPGVLGRIKAIGTKGSINYPMYLHYQDNILTISMAGTSEIWVCDVRTQVAERIAGSGAYMVADGSLADASIGQPAGIATDKSGAFYFTDARASSLRSMDSRLITSVLGQAEGDFGYSDGRKDKVKFQYPLGLCEYDNNWYIADSYNHTIRKVQPYRQAAETFAGNGTHGFKNGSRQQALFRTPTDVAVVGNDLFVADAGNGAIRKINLTNGMVSGVKLYNYAERGYGAGEMIYDVRDCDDIVIAPGENIIRYKIDLGSAYVFDVQGFSNAALSSVDPDNEIIEDQMRNGEFTVLINGRDVNRRSSFSFDFQLFFAEVDAPEKQFTRGVSFVQNFTIDTNVPNNQQRTIVFDPDSE